MFHRECGGDGALEILTLAHRFRGQAGLLELSAEALDDVIAVCGFVLDASAAVVEPGAKVLLVALGVRRVAGTEHHPSSLDVDTEGEAPVAPGDTLGIGSGQA